MKNKKREAMMIAAATAALLSMGITANAEDKVLNFGCAMYTDGVVNSAMVLCQDLVQIKMRSSAC